MTGSGAAENIDMVRPCPQCGASCMGEVHFRSMPTEGVGGQSTFLTDRPTVEEPLRDLVEQAIESGDYPGLPEFVRAWNEQRGWATFASKGAAVAAAELLATANAVLTAADPRTVDVEVWEALQRFVRQAVERGSENIWAVDE